MEVAKRAAAANPALDEIIAANRGKPGEVLSILEQAQDLNRYKYLPEETLNYISLKTGVPLTQLYNVVTFYAFFNLKPQGEHTIMVCRGTACHTKGSKVLLDDLLQFLGCPDAFAEGENYYTTPDNRFTIRTVACFGQCALAPVVSIDGMIHNHVTAGELRKLVGKIGKGAAKARAPKGGKK